MIEVTRLDGSSVIVNSDLIEFIEANPDTVITMTTSKKMVVRESKQELIRRVIEFRRQALDRPLQRTEASVAR